MRCEQRDCSAVRATRKETGGLRHLVLKIKTAPEGAVSAASLEDLG